MKQRFLTTICLFFTTATFAADGLITVESPYPPAQTIDRLTSVLESKGMTIFARIDHAAGAASAGAQLEPTELLVFGNPKVGTPLMQCNRTVAIDLPQKMLAWQDDKGQNWLAYNDPSYLSGRHGLDDCAETLKKVSGALANFATAATSQ